jgi:hypothetical protein
MVSAGSLSVSRWILEGEWSGYVSAQRRVVHREVIKGMDEFRTFCEMNSWIRYTDGTALVLSVRTAKPRERVEQVLGYSRLIRDCWINGVSAVADLPKKAMA